MAGLAERIGSGQMGGFPDTVVAVRG